MRLHRCTQHDRNQQNGNRDELSLGTLRFSRHIRTQKAARRPVADNGPIMCLGEYVPQTTTLAADAKCYLPNGPSSKMSLVDSRNNRLCRKRGHVRLRHRIFVGELIRVRRLQAQAPRTDILVLAFFQTAASSIRSER